MNPGMLLMIQANYVQARSASGTRRMALPGLGVLKDRTLRACYLCEAIFGHPGVFESESLYHLLMVCPHVSMSTAREHLKSDTGDSVMSDHGSRLDPLSPKPPARVW